jgi:hypothetical protein
MHVISLLMPFVLLLIGAAIGGVIGSTTYAVWGGIAGLLIGGVGSLVVLLTFARDRNLPE